MHILLFGTAATFHRNIVRNMLACGVQCHVYVVTHLPVTETVNITKIAVENEGAVSPAERQLLTIEAMAEHFNGLGVEDWHIAFTPWACTSADAVSLLHKNHVLPRGYHPPDTREQFAGDNMPLFNTLRYLRRRLLEARDVMSSYRAIPIKVATSNVLHLFKHLDHYSHDFLELYGNIYLNNDLIVLAPRKLRSLPDVMQLLSLPRHMLPQIITFEHPEAAAALDLLNERLEREDAESRQSHLF